MDIFLVFRWEDCKQILSVVFKKQHVILWCWKFHKTVRGKLENVLWSLVVQAENCTFCLHTDYWGTSSSNWINPRVHCEPQPKPWLFSQVWIREVRVVLPQNHKATQAWGYSIKPKPRFITAEKCESRLVPPGLRVSLQTHHRAWAAKGNRFLRPKEILGWKYFLGNELKHADVHQEQRKLREKTNPQLWLENKPALSAAQLFTSQEPMKKSSSVLTAQTCATWTLCWAYCSLAKGPFIASPASLRGEGGQWQSLPFSSRGLGNICYSRRAAEAPFQSSLCWELSDSWITALLSKSQTSVALPRVARCIQSPDTAAVTGRSYHCPSPAERCFCPPFIDLHHCPVQAGWMKMSAASIEQMWRDHALWPGFTHHVG